MQTTTSSRHSTRFFPFSPGIPWKLKNGKYVLPDLPGALLSSHLKGKDIVVAAFGGLIESFLSLCILEVYNFNIPGVNMFWAGHEKYMPLIKMNGLTKGHFPEIDQKTLDRFPVPLFFDKENRAYFNCLNNYRQIKTYYGTKGYRDKRPVVNQISEKGLIPWEPRFLPQMRGSNMMPLELDRRMKVARLNAKHPFVLIFPERTSYTQHKNINGLNWNMPQLRAFCTLMHQKGVKPIIMAENPHGYYSKEALVLPLTLEFMLYLMPKAQAVLSRDIDFLLLSNATSSATIISEPQLGEFKTVENNLAMGGKNVIYIREDINPIQATDLATRKL